MKNIFKYFKNLISKNKIATLTVVGVGPGDSSLLTIGAIRAIKEAKYIFFPVSNTDKKSFAAEIVKNYIKFKKKIPIIFPMARKELNPDQIWESAAKKIISTIDKNNSAVLLCMGDTSIFASSSYILNKIKDLNPQIIIKKQAGISSLSAAAAYANYDLVNQGETLKILECPNDSNQLTSLINNVANKNYVLALLKVGKRWLWVKEILKKEALLNNSLLASNIGMVNQFIDKASNNNSDNLPYFSLLIIRFN
ncbi:MAG: precorrin-2 C(20)-methyltransferase [Prochlorococcus sp. SP3034]|nr:precorrin-2 C(20)-methyltransferase [Prochlorococcus sp. SP3034]|tara:strand:+ start:1168 stop:1923 length:756 start_codon:yes stop_codon:yes gene_type:complete